MINSIKVLGIESSCDDTAAAVLIIKYKKNKYLQSRICSSIVFNQNTIHNSYGGVVPELAARAHTDKLDFSVEAALKKSQYKLKDIDLISVTSGPGLIGGLLSGVMFAKALALGLNTPIVGVNHLAGHALSPLLVDKKITFPYLILLVSGGHCQFLMAENATTFKRIGSTIDDAPGEAFDKTANILGLGYPGGAQIEKRALRGNPNTYTFPKPLSGQKNCNMSFSGLKTALNREVKKVLSTEQKLSNNVINNLCASFQRTVKDIFVEKSLEAMSIFKTRYPQEQYFMALVGGVAANKTIRKEIESCAEGNNFKTVIPPIEFCTDNAAMIALAGAQLYIKDEISIDSLIPRPRWPLDKTAPPLVGYGRKGTKS